MANIDYCHGDTLSDEQRETLTSVTISPKIKILLSGAFQHCKSLSRVVFPPKASILKEIQDEVFSGCESLTEIVVPHGVAKIGYAAFECCKNLKRIILPDSVIDIGPLAFRRCYSLDNVHLPENIEVIHKRTFCPHPPSREDKRD
mmetsp:Transcript_9972/g.18723  ORF Transcript_9972/g.18723 Transcript_9972/m.18723 type:complete len:145 (+) Transcript_9972:45-479(+)